MKTIGRVIIVGCCVCCWNRCSPEVVRFGFMVCGPTTGRRPWLDLVRTSIVIFLILWIRL